MSRIIPPSELIINSDGTIFHLHLHPEQIANRIIVVGDPARSRLIADRFDTIEHSVSNREFLTYTGTCNGERLSVVSTGIGIGNIDIVMNELDALANIDFSTREVNTKLKQLTIVRLGTCGAVQENTQIGDLIASQSAVSLDGLSSFYAGSSDIYNHTLSEEIDQLIGDNKYRARAIAIDSDRELTAAFSFAKAGVTISAMGFYGPQGRSLRVDSQYPDLVEKLASWSMGDLRVMNIEMEAAAIASLSRLMGHRATTICCAIAQRSHSKSNPDYGKLVDKMIESSLEILTSLK